MAVDTRVFLYAILSDLLPWSILVVTRINEYEYATSIKFIPQMDIRQLFFLWRQDFWKAATKDYVLECFIKNIVTRDSVWSRDNWIYYTDIVSNLFFFLFLNFENRLLYERLRIRTFYKDRGHDYRKGRMENSVREKRNMGYKPWSGWHRAIFQGT